MTEFCFHHHESTSGEFLPTNGHTDRQTRQPDRNKQSGTDRQRMLTMGQRQEVVRAANIGQGSCSNIDRRMSCVILLLLPPHVLMLMPFPAPFVPPQVGRRKMLHLPVVSFQSFDGAAQQEGVCNTVSVHTMHACWQSSCILHSHALWLKPCMMPYMNLTVYAYKCCGL